MRQKLLQSCSPLLQMCQKKTTPKINVCDCSNDDDDHDLPVHSNNKLKSTDVDHKCVASIQQKKLILILCTNGSVENFEFQKPYEQLCDTVRWRMEDVLFKVLKEMYKCINSSINDDDVTTIVL